MGFRLNRLENCMCFHVIGNIGKSVDCFKYLPAARRMAACHMFDDGQPAGCRRSRAFVMGFLAVGAREGKTGQPKRFLVGRIVGYRKH
jgi:hypothetical protein